MLTNLFLSLGLTRDSALWFWGRLCSGATIVLSIISLGGDHTILDDYLGPGWLGKKGLVVLAVIVMWLAGKFDSSTLPGRKP